MEYETQTSNEGTPNPALGPYISSAEFYISRGKKSYARTYIRISDALANVGGLMSLFTVVIETIFSFYLQNSYNKFIQEKFLKLNHEIKEDSNQNNNQIEINVLKGNFSNSKINVVYQPEVNMNKIGNKNGQEKQYSINIDNNNDSSKEIINNTKSFPLSKVNRTLKKMHKLDVILNKEIVKVIEYKKHKLFDVNISACDYFCFTNCCCKFEKDPNKNMKFNLFKESQKEIEKRIQILDYIKLVDQFKLIQKIILNKNQCYMLQKRELHRIIDSKILSVDEEAKKLEEKEKENRDSLCNYLSTRKSENSLSQIDILLFKYMENEIKSSIKQEISLDDVM